VLERLFLTAGFILACLLVYRFHRPFLDALKRFDEQNEERQLEELRDRKDQLAHFRHTISRAEEQVEEIGELDVDDERTGMPVRRYVFEGTSFATRDEAERARAEKIGVLARTFYRDLPAALSARKGDERLH
jgi:hypothetical protein